MEPKFIVKRDGRRVSFDRKRITMAVYKAGEACEFSDWSWAEGVTDRVVEQINWDKVPNVEEIQDIVEDTLIGLGHSRIAKTYIIYRNQHARMRQTSKLWEDAIEAVDDYLDARDWRVNENANMGYSLQGLNNYIASRATSQYWLERVYPPAVAQAHSKGDFHIHDLGMLSVYCCGWDLMDLLEKGFGGAYGKIRSAPARHLRTALGQAVNFFYTLQGEAAGAQAFSNFDTLLAPFIRVDNLNYEQVKQAIQEFTYNVNVPTRVGFQTPFTNITLDLEPPVHLAGMPAIIGGKPREFTYGDCKHEMNMFNKALCEVLSQGDADGRIFTFPIPTYNISEDLDWDDPGLDDVFKMTAKYGIPYFANYVGSDMKPEDARSMCCRLRLDNRELLRRGGGLFGSSPLTGSIGVVTLNLPRIGYLAKDESEFFRELTKLADLARDSLEIKRKALERLTADGLYPYAKHYLEQVFQKSKKYWDNHFSTIGLVGMHEACLNMLGSGIESFEGRDFSLKVLNFLREKVREYQVETGNLYNLEATPAESTSYRLAKLDADMFGERVLHSGQEEPYYTNSTHLPVGLTDDLFRALEHQEPLQSAYTGGTVFHAYLGERLDSGEQAKLLVKKVTHSFKIPYFTLTPTFTICPVHGYIPGEHFSCPYMVEEDESAVTDGQTQESGEKIQAENR
ncbi:MAG: ribonucleoside triphosphate reductase [Deltaproteobacteria bacterium]|nr:ribonucleoside triphosphate reductase [Deltaproteobacteria bacterium]